MLLYHSIGEVINAHKTWGSKFVENLAADIKLSFPDATGYSVRNLKYMAKFAAAYPGDEFVQQAVAQIPWGHNVVLMDKLSKSEERLWYAERSAENGWSRNVLVHQIESGLYQRQVLAEKVSNFGNRLPSPQSELAAQTMKDPYIFDFIPFKADMVERDIEQALVKDVTKLLLELGTGFAFLGNQYHLNVGGDDFYIDLLFYNLNLRCYVVIELKTGEFKPEYAGQLNFYLSAVDGILKKEQDNPSIGLLLCKSKNNLVAEYSLKDMSKPIGVSAYQITSSLPEELERQLPSVEDIQKRIKGLKKRRPRASLFLEQGTAVLLCKTGRLRAPAKRRADAARPPQVRRKNRTLAAVTAYSRRDERAETAETAGSKLIQHPQATGPQAVTAAQPAATPGRRHTRPIPPTAMQADATGGERRSVPGRSCGRSAPPRPPAGGS